MNPRWVCFVLFLSAVVLGSLGAMPVAAHHAPRPVLLSGPE